MNKTVSEYTENGALLPIVEAIKQSSDQELRAISEVADILRGGQITPKNTPFGEDISPTSENFGASHNAGRRPAAPHGEKVSPYSTKKTLSGDVSGSIGEVAEEVAHLAAAPESASSMVPEDTSREDLIETLGGMTDQLAALRKATERLDKNRGNADAQPNPATENQTSRVPSSPSSPEAYQDRSQPDSPSVTVEVKQPESSPEQAKEVAKKQRPAEPLSGYWHDEKGRLRRSDGKYASNEEKERYSQSEQAKQADAKEKELSLIGKLVQATGQAAKSTLSNDKAKDVEEVSGVAAGGSYFYAAKEVFDLGRNAVEQAASVKERWDDWKDKDSDSGSEQDPAAGDRLSTAAEQVHQVSSVDKASDVTSQEHSRTDQLSQVSRKDQGRDTSTDKASTTSKTSRHDVSQSAEQVSQASAVDKVSERVNKSSEQSRQENQASAATHNRVSDSSHAAEQIVQVSELEKASEQTRKVTEKTRQDRQVSTVSDSRSRDSDHAVERVRQASTVDSVSDHASNTAEQINQVSAVDKASEQAVNTAEQINQVSSTDKVSERSRTDEQSRQASGINIVNADQVSQSTAIDKISEHHTADQNRQVTGIDKASESVSDHAARTAEQISQASTLDKATLNQTSERHRATEESRQDSERASELVSVGESTSRSAEHASQAASIGKSSEHISTAEQNRTVEQVSQSEQISQASNIERAGEHVRQASSIEQARQQDSNIERTGEQVSQASTVDKANEQTSKQASSIEHAGEYVRQASGVNQVNNRTSSIERTGEQISQASSIDKASDQTSKQASNVERTGEHVSQASSVDKASAESSRRQRSQDRQSTKTAELSKSKVAAQKSQKLRHTEVLQEQTTEQASQHAELLKKSDEIISAIKGIDVSGTSALDSIGELAFDSLGGEGKGRKGKGRRSLKDRLLKRKPNDMPSVRENTPSTKRNKSFAGEYKAGGKGGGMLSKVGNGLKTLGKGGALAGLFAGVTKILDVKDRDDLSNSQKGAQVASTATGAGAGAIGGGALGATLGTMLLPGIGTAIGGFIGSTLGGLGGEAIGSSIGESISGFMGSDSSLSDSIAEKASAVKESASSAMESVKSFFFGSDSKAPGQQASTEGAHKEITTQERDIERVGNKGAAPIAQALPGRHGSVAAERVSQAQVVSRVETNQSVKELKQQDSSKQQISAPGEVKLDPRATAALERLAQWKGPGSEKATKANPPQPQPKTAAAPGGQSNIPSDFENSYMRVVAMDMD